MVRGKPIYLDGNDDEPEHTLTRKNATTGAEEPATGLTGLTYKLAAAAGGAAINASLSKTASERGTLAIYYAIFEGADLTTQLNSATYIGKDVVQIFGDAANVNYQVLRRVLAVRP